MVNQLTQLNAASRDLDAKACEVDEARLRYENFGDSGEHLTSAQVRRIEEKAEAVVTALKALYEELNAIQEEVDSERAILQREALDSDLRTDELLVSK